MGAWIAYSHGWELAFLYYIEPIRTAFKLNNKSVLSNKVLVSVWQRSKVYSDAKEASNGCVVHDDPDRKFDHGNGWIDADAIYRPIHEKFIKIVETCTNLVEVDQYVEVLISEYPEIKNHMKF